MPPSSLFMFVCWECNRLKENYGITDITLKLVSYGVAARAVISPSAGRTKNNEKPFSRDLGSSTSKPYEYLDLAWAKILMMMMRGFAKVEPCTVRVLVLYQFHLPVHLPPVPSTSKVHRSRNRFRRLRIFIFSTRIVLTVCRRTDFS